MIFLITFFLCLFNPWIPIIHCEYNEKLDSPWNFVEKKPSQTDHSHLFSKKTFPDGPSVTKSCLSCHPKIGDEFMKTAHWTWISDTISKPEDNQPIPIGKKTLINNFCISIESNWPKCTTCHAGYGWSDQTFEFSKCNHIDCLICHDQSGTYSKSLSGFPAEGVDLLHAAKSVGRPTRNNCGNCHFYGGGGNGVKHGDLDNSLSNPVERIDVHMGKLDFNCIDCHRTKNHKIQGRLMSTNITNIIMIQCTDCHTPSPHRVERLNDHYRAVACQTCHIPFVSKKEPTKIAWDWSTAGQDESETDPHRYLKHKGSFIYKTNLQPQYYWFNGNAKRYLKGERINPLLTTHINYPEGSIQDPKSKIWPFKIHYGKQPYDKTYSYLLIPQTVGKDGYWTTFKWYKALILGAQKSNLTFSGQYGFTKTDMYWKLSHMVSPGKQALQCIDCHGDKGRMNWEYLGYDGDPALIGGRLHRRIITSSDNQGGIK